MSALYIKYVSTPIQPAEFPQKNQFPKKPGFPLSTLTILVWYPYVFLVHDLLCNMGLSVSGLRKMRFNAYTPRRISRETSVPIETRIPVVQVNNFRLVFLGFFVPWFFCAISVWVSAVYVKYVSTPIHPVQFPQKNQFPKKPGFPLSALKTFDWYSYVFLLPDLLCNIGLSVSSLRKTRFYAYTLRRISTKKSVPKQTRIPVVRVDNFRLE